MKVIRRLHLLSGRRRRNESLDTRIPIYLREALLRQYGTVLAEKIAEGFAEDRPVTLRANTLKTSAEEVGSILNAAGIVSERIAWYSDAFLLPLATEDQIRALAAYQDGKLYLQGLSPMIPALLMPREPGLSLLDMCAAPGGKTTQLAALHQEKSDITACERDPVRAERLRFNLSRQGVRRVTVLNTDARQLDDMFRFDAILLDAPCTGSGTIRVGEGVLARRMTPEWVQKTVRTQTALIRKAAGLLKKGGILVYSTCSILEEENENQVRNALRQGLDLIPVDAALRTALPALPVSLAGTLCICPCSVCEGFFAAVLRKR